MSLFSKLFGGGENPHAAARDKDHIADVMTTIRDLIGRTG